MTFGLTKSENNLVFLTIDKRIKTGNCLSYRNNNKQMWRENIRVSTIKKKLLNITIQIQEILVKY